MDPRKLIEKSSFDPMQKKALTQAYDQAWFIVALRIDDASPIAAMKLALAQIILENAEECGFDVHAIVKEAVAAIFRQL